MIKTAVAIGFIVAIVSSVATAAVTGRVYRARPGDGVLVGTNVVWGVSRESITCGSQRFGTKSYVASANDLGVVVFKNGRIVYKRLYTQ
jgi:hypothetical protein